MKFGQLIDRVEEMLIKQGYLPDEAQRVVISNLALIEMTLQAYQELSVKKLEGGDNN